MGVIMADNIRQQISKIDTLIKTMEYAKTHVVKVGILASGGNDVVVYGSVHEYGAPKKNIPRRSFIKETFKIKADEMNKFISDEWQKVMDLKQTGEKGLGRIGVKGENLIKDAFETGGFGKWQDINEATKKRKKSTKILIDTGRLRSSITSVVERLGK